MHIPRPQHFAFDRVEIIEEVAEGVFLGKLPNGRMGKFVYEDEDEPEEGYFIFPDTTLYYPANT